MIGFSIQALQTTIWSFCTHPLLNIFINIFDNDTFRYLLRSFLDIRISNLIQVLL